MIPAKYKQYDDDELIALCRQGDGKAWEALVSRYRRLVYSIPLRFGLGPIDASDIFQSAFLKLIETLPELKDGTRVGWWLTTTTTRLCMAVRSQRSREGVDEEEEYDEPLDPADNLEDIQLQIEKRQTIRESVNRLPERCRELIERLYLEPEVQSYEQVAQALGMPVAGIGPTRARCLEKLRVVLKGRGIK